MAATAKHITSRDSAPIKRRLAELAKQNRATDLATLEHPELPECMRETARKRLKRLEEAKCHGPQMRLKPTTEG